MEIISKHNLFLRPTESCYTAFPRSVNHVVLVQVEQERRVQLVVYFAPTVRLILWSHARVNKPFDT